MRNQTIAAISTPLGPGGIGIIRISGPDALRILKTVFIRKKRGLPKKISSPEEPHFVSHFVYYGSLLHPLSKKMLDEVLVIYMKAPKSFTREDVVEIHSHSGFVVLDRVLSAVIDAGAMIADPGEFTRRAFINGRIDLSQAEAILDLINAPCETAAVIASKQVTGGFKKSIQKLSRTVLDLQAKCEATIEFPEDVDEKRLSVDIQRTLEKTVLKEIRSLVAKQRDAAVFKEGLHLSICGVPNVGKSSLLNKLVDRETAIVSELPGTTRDVVREFISIRGVPVVVYDTAGIHDSIDPVETLGIEKAKEQMGQSDLVLWVLDGSRKASEDEKRMIQGQDPGKTIVVVNKMDVSNKSSVVAIKNDFSSVPCIAISAKFGQNIDSLKTLIFKKTMLEEDPAGWDFVSPNVRQRKLLEKILLEAAPFSEKATTEMSIDVVSDRLAAMIRLLEQISGDRQQEDLYDSIFSQFCIGK